jgi:hypothetical protein
VVARRHFDGVPADVNLMLELEVRFRGERNISNRMLEHLPGKTVDQIQSKRARPTYKRMREDRFRTLIPDRSLHPRCKGAGHVQNPLRRRRPPKKKGVSCHLHPNCLGRWCRPRHTLHNHPPVRSHSCGCRRSRWLEKNRPLALLDPATASSMAPRLQSITHSLSGGMG